MKNRKTVLAVLGVLGLTILLTMVALAGETVTITGVVQAVDWDEEDNVIAVTISTDDGEFYVENSGKGVELLKMVDKKVKVTGNVSTDEDGFKTITVNSFEVVE